MSDFKGNKQDLPSRLCVHCQRPMTWRKNGRSAGMRSNTVPSVAAGAIVDRAASDLGDQLNPHHSWFDTCSPNVIYVMLELRAETAYVLHHAQKVIAIFAAMRAFASALKEKGHRVRYVRLSDGSNRGALEDNLNALVTHYSAGRVLWQEPDEWRLDAQLQAWAKTAAVETACVSSEHFDPGTR